MISAFISRKRSEINNICVSSGAAGTAIPDHVFQEVMTRVGNPPDIIVDYSFVQCHGGLGRGAGNCGAAKCLHERWVPGRTEYTLWTEYLD